MDLRPFAVAAPATRLGDAASRGASLEPFFIGVFDTVAALGSDALLIALVIAFVGILALVGYIQSFFLIAFLPVFLWSLVGSIIIAAVWYAVTHVPYAIGLPGYSFWQTLHVAAPKMQFYDKHLATGEICRLFLLRIWGQKFESPALYAKARWSVLQGPIPALWLCASLSAARWDVDSHR